MKKKKKFNFFFSKFVLDLHGPLRTSVASVDLRGPSRTFADLRGPPRTSVGLRGPPWTSADLLNWHQTPGTLCRNAVTSTTLPGAVTPGTICCIAVTSTTLPGAVIQR